MPDRRRRGLESQEMLAEFMQINGWPNAQSAPRGHRGRDVLGTPGLRVEVKARRELRPFEWLAQAEAGKIGPPDRPVTVEVPFVVFRPDQAGPADVGRWGMLLRVESGLAVLRMAGWGEPMPSLAEYLQGNEESS
jgi:hypothetical protein